MLKAWCELRMEGLQVLQMCLKSGGVCVCAEEEGGMPDCPELKSELLSSTLPISESEWIGSLTTHPLKERGHLKAPTHPALSDLGDEAHISRPLSERLLSLRVLARFAGFGSLSFWQGLSLSSSAGARGEQAVSLCQGSRDFLRVLAAYTDPQKVSDEHSRNLERCALLCSPMARVEL